MTAKGFNGSLDTLIAAAHRADASLTLSSGITIVALSHCGATAIDTTRPLILIIDAAQPAGPLPGRLGTGWELVTRLYGAERAVTLLPSGNASTIAACASGAAAGSEAIYLAGLNPLDAFATPWTMPWLSARLRAPDGCPWDREQTHASLVRYLIEETYEVVDALNALDEDDPSTDDALIEELGDLLYQIEFHSTIAEQQGRFSLADVARATHDKLVRRHPHVFGDVEATTAGDVVTTWDEIKRVERASKRSRADANSGDATEFFAGVSRAAPSLSLAQKLQKRAAEVGFDWPDVDGAGNKLDEEIRELRAAAATGDPEAVRMELGDVLFSVVNVARKMGLDAETALREASDKFVTRFTSVQRLAAERGIDLAACNLEQLDSLWEDAKRQLG